MLYREKLRLSYLLKKAKLLKFKKNKFIIATFFTIIIYLIYLKLMNIYPYGEYSILKSDLYQQYVNFLCYLKEIILNGKSIFMSWNLGLGNNFFTTFAYYLMSPLNIGVIFFKPTNMDIFVEILICIKIILAVNFAVLYFKKAYKFKDIEVVLFGLIYGYSSYVVCYSFHIMWLDSIYMLPLVLFFMDKFINTGKILPYTIAIAYTILTNYYMGYIVTFYSGIYFLAKYFIDEQKVLDRIKAKKVSIDTEKQRIKVFVKTALLFLIGILMAFGIGMIVILPSMEQLGSKISTSTKLFEIDIDKLRLFINILFNNYVYMFTQKSCFTFSSTIVLVLLPMYYLNKKIHWKEKVGFSAIVLFLLLPIISPFLNRVWHAFTIPNCFNYRYSFTLIFTLIIMAFREYQNKDGTSRKGFIFSLLVFSILSIIEIIFLKKGYLVSDGYTVSLSLIILSFVIYLIMLVLLFIIYEFSKNTEQVKSEKRIFVCKNKIRIILRKIAKLGLFGIVMIDLLIGAKSGQNNNDKYFKRSVWLQYDEVMEHILKKIEIPEAERIVFIPDKYGSNMSLKYGYSNIGFFSSGRNREVLKAMYRLGYNVQMDEQLWITSFSGTFLNYSIAGVKYFITKEKLNDEIFGFELDEVFQDFYIYRNKNIFDIGFYLSEDIEESYNPFKMQNDFLNALSKIVDNKENHIKETEENSYFDLVENSSVLQCNKILNFDEDIGEYIIFYNIKALDDCSIYIASDYNLQVYVDEKPKFDNYSNIWSDETGIKQIKHLYKDDEFKFIVKTSQNLDLLYIFASNNNKIQKLLDKTNNNRFSDVKFSSDKVEGTAIFEDDGILCFSINYDEHWKVYVDGKVVDKKVIANAFLGVKLEKGMHKIVVKYEL